MDPARALAVIDRIAKRINTNASDLATTYIGGGDYSLSTGSVTATVPLVEGDTYMIAVIGGRITTFTASIRSARTIGFTLPVRPMDDDAFVVETDSVTLTILDRSVLDDASVPRLEIRDDHGDRRTVRVLVYRKH